MGVRFPSGTIYPYYFFQRFAHDEVELLGQFRYKIGCSAHPS